MSAVADDADVVLGIPITAETAASIKTLSSSTLSSSMASSSFVSTASSSLSSARLTLSQHASHARSLVQSSQAFVVFGGYLRLRETAREWRMKTWYVALLRSQLYFYASKRDATRATNLVKRVTIAPNGVRPSDGHGKFHTYKHAFTFRTVRNVEFFCSAPSDKERALWIEQLTQAAAVEEAQTQASNHNSSSGSLTLGDDENIIDDDNESGPSSRHESVESSDGSVASLRTVLSGDSSSASGCFACGTAFGRLRHQRRTCRSCLRHFCRAHCSQYAAGVVTEAADASSSSSANYNANRSRVCDACSHRQHFIGFCETFTATVIRLLRHDNLNVSLAAATPAPDTTDAKLHKELAIIVASPASYTVLNVLCLLKKYAHVPWMFTRALCLLIPLYERNPAALEEYWTQLLILYVPLLALKEPFSPCMQFFLRFVSSVCRRSNAFTLRTVWECLAFSEDARLQNDRLTRCYLTLLMIACSSFAGGATYVIRKLLAHAPRAQVEAITEKLQDFSGLRTVLREDIPNSLPAKWFNAICKHDMDAASDLVLAAADGLDDPEVLLRILDPSETDYVAILIDKGVDVPVGTLGVDDECELEDEDTAFVHQKEREFDAQAAFVEQLTVIAERLRHVLPVEKRPAMLQELLAQLDQQHLARNGNDAERVNIHAPLLGAGGSVALDKLRLLRVVPSEGKVFSTRSRAPTMMVFEACRILEKSRPMAASITDTVIRGIPVTPEDEEGEEGDDLLEGELVMSAQLVSMRLRATSRAATTHNVATHTAIGHKESAMLDALLCGNDDSTSSGSNSSDAGDSGNGSNVSGDDSAPPPDELLMQEARETYEDSTLGHFMASFRGGESSAERSQWKRAIRKVSPFRDVKGWTVLSLIAKSHDDLRQEVFAMQLMRNLVEIFENNDLHRLYLRPYEILCTGANVGLIETLTDAQSVDAVKKQYGSLAEYFASQFGSPSSSRYQSAQDAFITSVAASSLYCYLFQIKDRHNGNIMLDQRGHIMHIDFGFMMGSAPGGAFSLEDAPFKLTREMVDLMGGLESRGYHDFVELFLEGFLAVRREYIKIVTLLHLTAQNSPYPCFQNIAPRHMLHSFRQRLFLSESEDAARNKIRRLVDKSYNHWGTRQYDRFQYSSNGILP